MRTIPTSNDDVIDSRDVIDRIEYLSYLEEEDYVPGDNDQDDIEELAALRNLEKEASESPDWSYGETLIRDSYFAEYAQEMAEEVETIPECWPFNCIDWKQAAEELKYDYFQVDFDGVKYWIRS